MSLTKAHSSSEQSIRETHRQDEKQHVDLERIRRMGPRRLWTGARHVATTRRLIDNLVILMSRPSILFPNYLPTYLPTCILPFRPLCMYA